MKAIVITEPGGPEVLRIVTLNEPEIAPDQVLVRVHASGINRPDVFQRRGNYPAPEGAPADVPGLEISGTIQSCGEKVIRWKICGFLHLGYHI